MVLNGNTYQGKSNSERVHGKKHLINKFSNYKNKFSSISLKTNTNDEEFTLYVMVCVTYIIGIILGAIYFRFLIKNSEIKNSISEKTTIIENIVKENDYNIENEDFHKNVLLTIATKNLKLLIIYWIVGVSIIGAPLLILLCLYKGFSISITISSIIVSLGFLKGNLFVLGRLFIFTLFTLLAMVIATVSSMKVFRNVFKNKKDIKFEFIRHSIITLLCGFLLIISTFLENFSLM